MKKNATIKRSAKSGEFVSKPLGVSKAKKFSLVEGMALKEKHSITLKHLKEKGLKGDDLRSAISGSFQKKP